MAEYFVIDEGNNTSFTDDAEPERFGDLKAATKRAGDLAALSPGETFKIVTTIATVVAEVSDPIVSVVAVEPDTASAR